MPNGTKAKQHAFEYFTQMYFCCNASGLGLRLALSWEHAMTKHDSYPMGFHMPLDNLEAIDQSIRTSMLTTASLLILCGCFILLNA